MRPAQGFSIARMARAGTDSLRANKALNIKYLERWAHNPEEGQLLIVRVAPLAPFAARVPSLSVPTGLQTQPREGVLPEFGSGAEPNQ